jgi:hypothetical protein
VPNSINMVHHTLADVYDPLFIETQLCIGVDFG